MNGKEGPSEGGGVSSEKVYHVECVGQTSLALPDSRLMYQEEKGRKGSLQTVTGGGEGSEYSHT